MQLVAVVLSYNGRDDTWPRSSRCAGSRPSSSTTARATAPRRRSRNGSPTSSSSGTASISASPAATTSGSGGRSTGVQSGSCSSTTTPRPSRGSCRRWRAAAAKAGRRRARLQGALRRLRPALVRRRRASIHPRASRHEGFGEPDEPGELADTPRATGAAMAVSRAAIDAAGPARRGAFLYAEDLEWSLRIREAGFASSTSRGEGAPPRLRRHRRRRSPTTSYYEARNMLAVVERYRPLPRGLTGVRRGLVVGPARRARRAPPCLGLGCAARLARLPPRADGPPGLACRPWPTSAATSTAASSNSCSTRASSAAS
jgi:hypothetical protein